MAIVYGDIEKRVKRFIKADSLNVLKADDYKDTIIDALDELSGDIPCLKTISQATDSTGFYSLPSDWDDVRSVIVEIEYPKDDLPKTIIYPEHYEIDLFTDAYKLRFNNANPGGDFYIRYTVPYTINEVTGVITNITDSLAKVAAWRACVDLCEILAAHFASRADSNIPELAQMVNFSDRVSEWTGKAKEYMKRYKHRVQKQNVALGVTGSINEYENNRDFFTRRDNAV